MINVSNGFKEWMKERRDFKENAEITFADGKVLELSASDFTISNNNIVDAAETSGIPLGVAISRGIQIELMNDDERFSTYDFFGAKIRLYLTFELSETTEKIEEGTFTVINPETYGETVIVTANDDMHKADKPYSTTLSFPQTAGTVLRDICSTCDIPLTSTEFLNDDFVILSRPSGDYTFRQIIGYIAMIAAGNARINRQGTLEIITYDFAGVQSANFDGGTFNPWTSGHTLDGGTFNPWSEGDIADGGTFADMGKYHVLHEFKTLKVGTDDVVITGIQTTVESGGERTTILEGVEGYVLSVENPLIAGQEKAALSLIGAVLIGAKMRPFEADHIAYPLAEFMDPAIIVDRKGNIYGTILTDITFNFFGFTTMKNSAAAAARNSSRYTSESVKAIIAAKEFVEKEKTERELAVGNLNKALTEASGMFSTDEEQEDGSTIRYLHDKKTLAESTNVMKVTAEAIGFSTDGGATYPFGLMINGDVITNILTAIGINADWINTGSFKAQAEAFVNPKIVNVQKMLKFISGEATPTAAELKIYDLNCSGTLTVADSALMQNLIAGKITIEEIVSRYGYEAQTITVTVEINPRNPRKAIHVYADGTNPWGNELDYYFGSDGIKTSAVDCDSLNTQQLAIGGTIAGAQDVWTGSSYLGASDSISIDLASCINGIVLTWSRASTDDETSLDYQFNDTIILKNHPAIASGGGISCFLQNVDMSVLGIKYVYVSETEIKGYSNNDTYFDHSIFGQINNREWVLVKITAF